MRRASRTSPTSPGRGSRPNRRPRPRTGRRTCDSRSSLALASASCCATRSGPPRARPRPHARFDRQAPSRVRHRARAAGVRDAAQRVRVGVRWRVSAAGGGAHVALRRHHRLERLLPRRAPTAMRLARLSVRTPTFLAGAASNRRRRNPEHAGDRGAAHRGRRPLVLRAVVAAPSAACADFGLHVATGQRTLAHLRGCRGTRRSDCRAACGGWSLGQRWCRPGPASLDSSRPAA